MILRSIRIEGWRCIINPVHVGPFSDGLNVLHAPNATGKSTLFEALLRGLLDGHRVSGREVEGLRPWGRSLAPTVTIEFAHGGTDYRLTKRFLDSPLSDLKRLEKGRFVPLAQGDAADEHVREIFTRNPPGRGLARPENWGLAQVLWAPQGNLVLSKLSGDLIADIRGFLSAEVSGPGAGPLEKRIEETYLQIYTPGGKLKAGKDAPPLVRLREKHDAAVEKRRIALVQQQTFEEAVRKVEDFRARRAQAKRDAEAFAKALSEARSKAESYAALLSDKREREERVKAAEAQYSALKQRVEAIKADKKELREAQEVLSRLEGEVPLRAREAEERDMEAAKAKGVLEDARKGRQTVDETQREADLARRYLDAKEEAAELGKRLRQIAQANRTLTPRKKERSGLVAPDAKAMRAIRKAIRRRDDAQLRLEAALITLEIVPEKKGSLTVVVGEEAGTRSLTPGRPTAVKGLPEVVVDLAGTARLRAWGPSGSVEDIRNERDEAARKLNELTIGFGTTDLEELESLRERASDLDKQIAEVEAQVETLLSGYTLERIEQDLAKVTTILEEILEDHPAWKERPPDLEGLVAAAEQVKRSFITAVENAEADWESAQAALAAAREQKTRLGVKLEETEKQAKSLEARVADLTADGRADEERETELKKVALSWDAAKAVLDEIEGKLKAFGEDPRGAVTKLEKQLQSADEAATKALEDEKGEEGRLEHLSAQGPYSTLVQAEEEVATLKGEIAREELRTGAIRLLREMVAQCRAEAVAAVAGPVERVASRTLQRIAGGRLGGVQLGEAFEPAQVLPEVAGTSVPLDSVSGGEREQIYLATRLALAEVLAKDERQLVVLDDVLMATDAGRLARVMTILEEAAQRLQVLILTCHPERYRGLDLAQFVDFEATLRNGAEA